VDERSAHPGAAGFAAAKGVVAGAAIYAATGTLRVLVSPGLDVASPLGWLAGPLWVFAGGFFWGLVGGALFVLLPLFLVFLRPPLDTFPWRLALSTAVFLPLFLLGLGGRIVDGALLAVAVWAGVRTALRELARRTGAT
jgi:hypothetical protein